MGQPSSRVGEIWKRYRGRIVTLVVLALVVFPLLFAFNVLPGLPPEKVAQTQVSYSKMPRDSGLSVSLEAPPSRLSASANVALELILTNTGANPIKIKALSTSGCLQLINLNPPMLIRAHQSIRRSPALRLQCLSGQFLLTLFFTWEECSSSAEYEGFAATSPITALSSTYEFWQRFISIDSFLLRTFSLPLVLLLVGYFLQVSQTERDAKLKEDQADRDAKLKVEQDARDSRSQILNTLLPEYSKLVQEHYLTITR